MGEVWGSVRSECGEVCWSVGEVEAHLERVMGVWAGLELSIRNRYSLPFRHRLQNLFTFFFHYRLGLFPTFLRGKSILITVSKTFF